MHRLLKRPADPTPKNRFLSFRSVNAVGKAGFGGGASDQVWIETLFIKISTRKLNLTRRFCLCVCKQAFTKPNSTSCNYSLQIPIFLCTHKILSMDAQG
uniref:Uncharacterized protein n=1 Tax=Fundulus heteroclitus TaxID=8078 RepID=A0A146SR34_FUNHE